MAFEILELGQTHTLALSDIKLSVLPELRSAVERYFGDGSYVFDALSPRKRYAESYLKCTEITVVQNDDQPDQLWLIDNFEFLDIINRYPPSDLATQTIRCLVRSKPESLKPDCWLADKLTKAMLWTGAAKQHKTKVHDLLREIQAAANDNDKPSNKNHQARERIPAEPLPKLERPFPRSRKGGQTEMFEFPGDYS